MFARHWMFKTGFWGFGSNQHARETNQDISSSEVPSPIDGLVAVNCVRIGMDTNPTDSPYDHYVYCMQREKTQKSS